MGDSGIHRSCFSWEDNEEKTSIKKYPHKQSGEMDSGAKTLNVHQRLYKWHTTFWANINQIKKQGNMLWICC